MTPVINIPSARLVLLQFVEAHGTFGASASHDIVMVFRGCFVLFWLLLCCCGAALSGCVISGWWQADAAVPVSSCLHT
jgi:hypothetical protein